MNASVLFRPRGEPAALSGVWSRLRRMSAQEWQGGARLWLTNGGPIAGLIALVAATTVILLLGIAREQDIAFQRGTSKLVVRSLDGALAAVDSNAKDNGVWAAASKNISENWNEAWVRSNIVSSAYDAMVVFSPKEGVRYVWAMDSQHRLSAELARHVVARAADAEAFARIATAAETEGKSARNYLVVRGQLVIASTSAISREGHPAIAPGGDWRNANFLTVLQVMDAGRIREIADAIGVQDLEFRADRAASSLAGPRLSLMVPDRHGNPVGWLGWRDERPGSAAFARRVTPLAFALVAIGILAFWASFRMISRQFNALQTAQAEAEGPNRMKSEFLANMSHGLRTPLNAVIGYAEMIEEESEASGRATEAEDPRRIRRAARHLLGLIDGILELSKIEAGKMQLHPEPVRIVDLVDEVVELMRPGAQRNGYDVQVQCETALGVAIVDPMRLKQCLVNIANNACKFTTNGTITIRAEATTLDRRDAIRFEIADSGIGMTPAAMARLFTPFMQADGSITRRFGGTGLGLAITRRILDLMDGTVSVRSAPGEGSTFTVIVPRGRGAMVEAA